MGSRPPHFLPGAEELNLTQAGSGGRRRDRTFLGGGSEQAADEMVGVGLQRRGTRGPPRCCFPRAGAGGFSARPQGCGAPAHSEEEAQPPDLREQAQALLRCASPEGTGLRSQALPLPPGGLPDCDREHWDLTRFKRVGGWKIFLQCWPIYFT